MIPEVRHYAQLSAAASQVLSNLPADLPEAREVARAVQLASQALQRQLSQVSDEWETQVTLTRLQETLRRAALTPPLLPRREQTSGNQTHRRVLPTRRG